MNNRKHNSKNPYQGKAKKVLCVCSAGLLRSPTAANVIHQKFGHNTRACGISTDFALIPFDDVLADWADEIVVMEPWMARVMPEEFQGKVYCLNVEDSYEYMHPDLQKQIEEKYGRTHGNTGRSS